MQDPREECLAVNHWWAAIPDLRRLHYTHGSTRKRTPCARKGAPVLARSTWVDPGGLSQRGVASVPVVGEAPFQEARMRWALPLCCLPRSLPCVLVPRCVPSAVGYRQRRRHWLCSQWPCCLLPNPEVSLVLSGLLGRQGPPPQASGSAPPPLDLLGPWSQGIHKGICPRCFLSSMEGPGGAQSCRFPSAQLAWLHGPR